MSESGISHADLVTALERGGLQLGNVEEKPSRHFEASRDPGAAELLGRALARASQETRPTVIMTWYDYEHSVLGHIVARELSTPVVQAYEASGVLGVEGSLRSTDRVLIVSDYLSSGPQLQQMQALITNSGARNVGIATLVATPTLAESADIPAISLLRGPHG